MAQLTVSIGYHCLTERAVEFCRDRGIHCFQRSAIFDRSRNEGRGMVELRRHFPGKPCQISEIRDFVRTGCRRVWNAASDNKAISQLELAVSEAASNIILHGLQGPPGETIELIQNIELILKIDEQQASLTFLYPGCGFTPQAVPKPDFTGQAESGYGLYLIQQSVDEVHYSRNDAGLCTIRFIKNRR